MASKDDFEKGVAAPTLNKIRIVSLLSRASVLGAQSKLRLFAHVVLAAACALRLKEPFVATRRGDRRMADLGLAFIQLCRR